MSRRKLLKPHQESTAERVKLSEANYILSIQDNVVLNYTSHKAKTEIGRIGKTGKTEQYGLIQHNVLCVTDKNEALGLLDIQHFHHDDFEVEIERDKRSLEEKKNICWIEGSRARRRLLGDSGKRVITVADREGDFFEFLHELRVHKESFVIRAMHNRNTGKKRVKKCEDKLFDVVGRQEALGRVKTQINDVETREIKEIELTIKCLKGIDIPVPRRPLKQKEDYIPLSVNVLMAYNDDYCWVLLTDLGIETLVACEEVIKIYKSRWHIEDFHKILKTGYQVDELYLHASRQAIENALTMASISACRLYWIIYVGRVEEKIKANELFEEWEWKSLYVYFKESIPLEPPSLSSVILKIARLGGYKMTKNAKPPGIKTLWIGFQGFNIAAQLYRNMRMSMKT